MNVAQALSLRKPDRQRNLTQGAHTSADNRSGASRFSNKRSNIKDILVRNFFKKYPIDRDMQDIQQLQVERNVAVEMEKFIIATKDINSKNLSAFENQLAMQQGLKKTRTSISQINKMSPTSNTQRGQYAQKLLTHARASESGMEGIKMSSRKDQKPGEALQLPDIYQGMQSSSIADLKKPSSQGVGFNARSARRSQGIGLGQSAEVTDENIYTSGQLGASMANKGLGKILANQIPNNQGRYPATKKGATLQHSASGLAHLEASGRMIAQKEDYRYPSSTINKYQNGHNVHKSSGGLSGQIAKRNTSVKLPGARSVQVDDLPSDISEDEWGEIQKFGQRLHEEKLRKEKENALQKVRNVRDVLDKQVAVRQELQMKAKNDRQEFDRKILEQAKAELEQENEQKKVLQDKMLQAKKMREQMILDAKNKRDHDKKQQQLDERDQVAKLQADIERERKAKIQKKTQERAAAQKVIKENQMEKAKRNEQVEADRRKDAQEIEAYIQHQIAVEKKREQEIADRGARIAKVMDSMADLVPNKDKEMQAKQDRDYIEACIAKDEQSLLQDIDKRNNNRKRHQQVKYILDQQVREKELNKEAENRANRSFMNRWSQAVEKDDKDRMEVERQRKEKLISNQEFLKEQITRS